MFDWLFEGRLSIYLMLVTVGLCLVGLWWRDRRRVWMYPLTGVGLLIGAYWLLDRIVETRQEQIERKLQEMAAGVKAGDASKIAQHISDTFKFQGLDKAGFRRGVEMVLRNRRVTDLSVWEFQPVDPLGKIVFRANPKGNEPGLGIPYIVRAQFVRDADGQWRLQSFTISNSFSDTDKPISIPQLGP